MGISRIGLSPSFDISGWPGTVMASADVSFCSLMCYNEHILRLKVQWKLICHIGPIHSNLFMSNLGLCHSVPFPPILLTLLQVKMFKFVVYKFYLESKLII